MSLSFLERFDLESSTRLLKDALDNFYFLQRVPATHVKLFLDFARQLSPGQRGLLIKEVSAANNLRRLMQTSSGPPALPQGTLLSEFEAFKQQQQRLWKFMGLSVKQTIAALIARTGRLPRQLIEEGDDVPVEAKREEGLSVSIPTTKDILSCVSNSFAPRLVSKETDGQDYVLSSVDGRHRYATHLTLACDGKMMAYYHKIEIGGKACVFDCLDHAAGTQPIQWDNVSSEGLRGAVEVLAEIVRSFEERCLHSENQPEDTD